MTCPFFRYRLSSLIVVAAMLLSLSSCGSGTDPVGTDQGGTDQGGTDQGDSDQGDTDQGGTDQGDTDQGVTPVQPNILLVITDDQGLDASAQYSFSADLPNTPVIDSLAQAGITYENVWATPSCSTTRAALLTGRHGVETGVLSVPGNLPAEFGTIQAYLSENEVSSNYDTAVFGKWHVDGNGGNLNHPNDFGVDHYDGHLKISVNFWCQILTYTYLRKGRRHADFFKRCTNSLYCCTPCGTNRPSIVTRTEGEPVKSPA